MYRNTSYTNYNEDHNIVQWFWKVVESFTPSQRSLLLKFITGSPRPPARGFLLLPGSTGEVTTFQIVNLGSSSSHLPSVHTCFNQLNIPSTYESYEVLREKLLHSMSESNSYFSLR